MKVHPIGLDRAMAGARPDQRRVYAAIESGPRGSVPSPFLAMLDAPELADAVQAVGVAIRFGGELSEGQRELAILATAGAIGCGYEWDYHLHLAKKAGVPALAIAATLSGEFLPGLDPEHATVIAFCRGVTLERRSGADILATTIAMFGRAKTAELIAISGYYALLASFIFIGGHDI